jgi:hypothetical protein
MKNKEHLSIEGLQKIINIKTSMNLGLSDILKSELSKITPVERPIIITNNIPDANWVSGFTSGEVNFDVRISKSKSVKIGYYVTLRFRIYQHERDIKLIELLIKYLGAGKIEKHPSNPIVNLTINKISVISKIIIPYFVDWCKIVKLMNEGSHRRFSFNSKN